MLPCCWFACTTTSVYTCACKENCDNCSDCRVSRLDALRCSCDYLLPPVMADYFSVTSASAMLVEVMPSWLRWHANVIAHQRSVRSNNDARVNQHLAPFYFKTGVPRIAPFLVRNVAKHCMPIHGYRCKLCTVSVSPGVCVTRTIMPSLQVGGFMIAGCSQGSHLTKPSSVWVHALKKLVDPATPPTPPIPSQAGPCDLTCVKMMCSIRPPKSLVACLRVDTITAHVQVRAMMLPNVQVTNGVVVRRHVIAFMKDIASICQHR